MPFCVNLTAFVICFHKNRMQKDRKYGENSVRIDGEYNFLCRLMNKKRDTQEERVKCLNKPNFGPLIKTVNAGKIMTIN